jgi:hypothetical protein
MKWRVNGPAMTLVGHPRIFVRIGARFAGIWRVMCASCLCRVFWTWRIHSRKHLIAGWRRMGFITAAAFERHNHNSASLYRAVTADSFRGKISRTSAVFLHLEMGAMAQEVNGALFKRRGIHMPIAVTQEVIKS